MKQKLARALTKDFPLTFAKNTDGMEPWSMFGFECGDGWEPSIRQAAEQLEPLIRAAKDSDPEGYSGGYYRTAQLKEKYGTGRWYFNGTDRMQEIVSEWEQLTDAICEQCGKPGELRGHSWYYTACLDHTKEEDLDSLEIVEKAYVKKERKNDK